MKLLTICTYISAALFIGFAGIYIYILVHDYNPYAEDHNVYLSRALLHDSFHVAITQGGGGSLLFFNQPTPYTGSIISFAGDDTVTERGLTGYGIYFRLIKYLDKRETSWTLMISLWYPIIMFFILPTVFAIKNLRAVRHPTPIKGQPPT
jgi:hypothetical protein